MAGECIRYGSLHRHCRPGSDFGDRTDIECSGFSVSAGDEALARLLELNAEHAKEEARSGAAAMSKSSGKPASPEFCLALGVSSSSHHIAQIQKSGKIFVVTSDEHGYGEHISG